GESDNPTKAVLLRELAKLPATEDTIATFKAGYESIPLDTQIPPGQPALEVLTESSGQFFDASLVDWLLTRAESTKGDADDRKALQQAVTQTVLKLSKPDQLPSAKRAVDKYGSSIEKGLYTQAETLLKACGDRAACYAAAAQKSENQKTAMQFTGIK